MEINSNLKYRNCIYMNIYLYCTNKVYIQTSINEKYTANKNTKYNFRL